MANGKPGRPATGQVPVHSIRMGPTWDEARAAAMEDGLRFAEWLERVIRAELRHRHIRAEIGRIARRATRELQERAPKS